MKEYYPSDCTIEYALKKDEVISDALECVSAKSHLETLCKQFSAEAKEFETKISSLPIGVLTPTQDGIEEWKYNKVVKIKEWDGPPNEFFKKGDKVDYSEESIVVLHCNYGSESGTYILSGHTRARKRLDDKKYSIKCIIITTSNKKVHDAYINIASNLTSKFSHRPTIHDLGIIKK